MWFITFNTALNGWERYQSLFDQVAQSFTLLKEMEELEDNREIGLQAIILEQGEGEEAKAGDILSVYYSGELEDGTQFDAREEGEPFTFTLGAGKVIAGWDQGLVGMKVGEKRKLVIPSELAYGEQGRPGAIPPNAVLIFRVELLKIGE
ncbi:FKBP-type peptidyl-prolyl cis-trans isomerase [Patescibacteria group bacterium]|nr:FKBP-type peptidyl-prolyl cis-trans isomerase [Patescibacteria group bacterium]MBU4078069.1 FKBP-type peptidyl-prolyl cis-trans isomerase [Patescibacteria group bacterium]